MDYSYLCLVKAFSPDEAVKHMKAVMEKQSKPMVQVSSNDTSFDGLSSSSSVDNPSAVKDDKAVDNAANETSNPQASAINPQASASSSTIDVLQCRTMNSTARANLLNQHDLVQFDANAKVFTVRSMDQRVVHAVHMSDPKRKFRCSCPSIDEDCAHVLAVKVYLGM